MFTTKKIISALLLCTLLITSSLPVFATGNDVAVSSTADKTTYHRGDTVTIQLSLDTVTLLNGLAGIDIDVVTYDETKMNFVSATAKVLPTGWMMYGTSAPLMIVDDSGNNPVKASNGIILEFSFSVKNTASFGYTSISVSGSGTSAGDLESVAVGFDTCSITIECVHIWEDWTKIDDTNHQHICSVCENVVTAKHNWNKGAVTTSPTHMAEGVKTYTCSDCGATKTEVVSKLTEHAYGAWTKYNDTQHKKTCVCGDVLYENHAWNAGKITTAPTCKDTGIKTYTCTLCGETKTGVVPKTTDHNYGVWVKVDKTTHKHTCSVCGNAETASHKWNAGVVTTQPTHLAEGVKTYTCTVCGETKTEAVAKVINHTYGAWVKVDETTHKHTCSVCGNVDTASHNWDSGKVTKPATEETIGIRIYKCTDCGATREEAIPKLDHEHEYGSKWFNDSSNHWVECTCSDKDKIAAHTFDSGTVTKSATCLEDGVMLYKCNVCGCTKVESFKGSHNNGDWIVSLEATCTVDGMKECKCTVCDKTIESEIIKATGHNSGEWVISNESTCTESGMKQKKCLTCEEILEEEVIPATGHTYGDWNISNGVMKRTCSCGETETKNIDKKVASIISESDGIIIKPGTDSDLPDGTAAKTENLTNKLTEKEKTAISDAIKLVVTDDNGSELVSVYNISLEYDGSEIHLDGTVKVELPIPTGARDKFKNYVVVYMDGDGAAHEIPTEVKDGRVIFATGRFNHYALVGIKDSNITVVSGFQGNMIILWVSIGAAVIVFVAIIIIAKKRKTA